MENEIVTEKEDDVKEKEPSVDDVKEIERIIKEPFSYVRKKIREQVKTHHWLINLRKTYEYLAMKKQSPDFGVSRCAICSLPEGTCKHTEYWFENAFSEFSFNDEEIKTEIDKEIDDVLAVIQESASTGPKLESKYVEDIDVFGMRWSKLEQRDSDKIESMSVCLSAPTPRGWHSCVSLADDFIIVFGGFSYKKKTSPQPLTLAPRPDEVTYHQDTLIYDIGNLSWHTSRWPASSTPRARYGHVTAALNDRLMVIFGGRSSNGMFLNDTWIFDLSKDSWMDLKTLQRELLMEEASSTKYLGAEAGNPTPSGIAEISEKKRNFDEIVTNYPSPSPRVHASMCAHGHDLYLFGGTDGVDNFGDLWVLTGGLGTLFDPKEGISNVLDVRKLRWEQVLAIGDCPSPRYGHSLVLLPYETPPPPTLAPGGVSMSLVRGPRLALLGGCDVSPLAESDAMGVGLSPTDSKIISDLCSDLQSRYLNEGHVPGLLGESLHLSTLQSHLGDEPGMIASESMFQDLASRTFDGSFATASLLRSTPSLSINPPRSESEMRSLLRRAAGISGTIASLEKETRDAELRLLHAWYSIMGQRHLKKQRARHSQPKLEISFFYLQDRIWKTPTFPPVSGSIPPARIFFGCVSTQEHIVITGGLHCSALKYDLVDGLNTWTPSRIPSSSSSSSSFSNFPQTSSSKGIKNEGESRVYVLDLRLMKWVQPSPQLSKEGMNEPLRAADADIIRAIRRIEAEKNRGFSLGAPEGFTAELAQAQAVLEVCKWRKSLLERERDSLRPPPSARWGCTFIRVRQRCLLICGWGTKLAIPPLGTAEEAGNMVLDMEGDMERLRRIHEEFRRKVERESSADAIQTNLKEIQSAFELRAQIREERQNQSKERRRMAIEDICSSMPPLTRPSPPRLSKATQSTIWVAWDRPTRNADNQKIDPESVTYFLYMKPHLEHFLVEDRVLVKPPPQTKILSSSPAPSAPASPTSSPESTPPSSPRQISEAFSSLEKREKEREKSIAPRQQRECLEFPGEITFCKGGFFTIAFDDGTVEQHVPRSRIRLAGNPLLVGTGLQLRRENEEERDLGAQFNALTLSLAAKRRLARIKWRKARAREKLLRFNPSLSFSSIGVGLSSEDEKKWKNRPRVLAGIGGIGGLINNRSRQGKDTGGGPNQKNETFTLNEQHGHEDEANDHLQEDIDIWSLGNKKKKKKNGQQNRQIEVGDEEEEEDEEDDNEDELKRLKYLEEVQSETESEEKAAERRRNRKMQGSPTMQEIIPSVEVSESTPPSQGSSRATSRPLSGVSPSTGSTTLRLRTTTEFTIQLPPGWTLVYVGNENEYACEGLAPQLVLEGEPSQTASVSFLLQTHGLEFPHFERSQLSEIVTFDTRPCRCLPYDRLEEHQKSSINSISSVGDPSSLDSYSPDERGSKLVSRLKRDVLSTVVDNTHVIQIYQEKDGCYSTGVSFHYL